MTDRALRAAIVLGAIATVLVAVLYVAAQQAVRHAADHPQVEMARAAASRLDGGAAAAVVVPTAVVDIAQSPDAYLIVVDSHGAVVASSANLNGDAVVPPSGVFDYVRAHGEDVISWQPAPGVRSAIVVDAFNGGFVVAGRSLKDTENLESSLLPLAAAVWALAIVAAGALAMTRFR
jgi:hypothetical protein